MLRIANGRVHDPTNTLSGTVQDIVMDKGAIISTDGIPQGQLDEMETIDATDCVVMAGGVDIHSHIAGAKVNTGRIMCPEEHYSHVSSRTKITRAGCGRCVPTTYRTGYLYSKLGYTTVFEAAVPPLEARHTHEELQDLPMLDKGCYTVMGNNHLVMQVLSDTDPVRRKERLRNLVSWLLKASRGYGIKVVNPGGVEDWKWNVGAADLDTPTPPFGVTPRQILGGLAEAVDDLKLPHSMHLHCNHLGEAGNVATTLETMRTLEGHRAHFTHLQFHSYGKTPKGGFTSGTVEITDYLNKHPEFTFDVGQIVFGSTLTMTSDAPMEFHLHQMTKGKWASGDIEMESGSGIVPITYKPKMLVNAIQWAVGLELLLLTKNPWQVVLTTDHPNAGPFTAYPQIIKLLMDKDYRQSWVEKLHPKIRQFTCLFELDREYTLDEIAIITRSGPARTLGLDRKGHIGVGAEADVTIYRTNTDKSTMFSTPAYVIKHGEVVVRDGEIVKSVTGKSLGVSPEQGERLDDELTDTFDAYYTVKMANYMVEDEYLDTPEVVPCG
ncbi:formylmethanofuran dehydrogenase subunit A [Pseudodesulfovibrio sp. JC047]|uniref:formylmethanofuran dehydrogenase subunit A n=1 Tax=Pseudodesulfovibrio sp. JC047 TaxID=2683199 RepID=UPI0013D5531A|nr:formylmethanofuran dehydrogenase subunit A [Pseudodesulfovibrio sp. JC047]NDV19425.1 formylmethanofuran dehydrogenase subunit A [Pseudodesulfovibrio sp. JC047]